ncbi:hypothetical protein CALCODRAFT_488352 [Calocera cornea HHB12733]|uniref:Uncharacterized protein n=1 Tax=Calocera cornea HHB12733 TaxID=1353952 RepID=A0A165CIT9_9BASI|nr:hypothetical protein CALCODRAFT_488352 [Calocera cornea HHB12733]
MPAIRTSKMKRGKTSTERKPKTQPKEQSSASESEPTAKSTSEPATPTQNLQPKEDSAVIATFFTPKDPWDAGTGYTAVTENTKICVRTLYSGRCVLSGDWGPEICHVLEKRTWNDNAMVALYQHTFQASFPHYSSWNLVPLGSSLHKLYDKSMALAFVPVKKECLRIDALLEERRRYTFFEIFDSQESLEGCARYKVIPLPTMKNVVYRRKGAERVDVYLPGKVGHPGNEKIQLLRQSDGKLFPKVPMAIHPLAACLNAYFKLGFYEDSGGFPEEHRALFTWLRRLLKTKCPSHLRPTTEASPWPAPVASSGSVSQRAPTAPAGRVHPFEEQPSPTTSRPVRQRTTAADPQTARGAQGSTALQPIRSKRTHRPAHPVPFVGTTPMPRGNVENSDVPRAPLQHATESVLNWRQHVVPGSGEGSAHEPAMCTSDETDDIFAKAALVFHQNYADRSDESGDEVEDVYDDDGAACSVAFAPLPPLRPCL